MADMTTLEEKEIRGINLKLIRAFTIGTITVVCSILYSYFSLQSAIREIEIERTGQDKYIDLRIKALELNFQSMQLQINDIRNREDQTLNKNNLP